MAKLVVGTQAGLFEPGDGTSTLERRAGPPDVPFLAPAADGLVALTSAGAVWGQTGDNDWRELAPGPAPAEVWSFGADPRLPGRLYLGVSPALVYRTDDNGQTWHACDSVRSIPGYERWTFPPPPHIPHVRSIVPDPTVVGGVLIGVEEGGVYRSPDGGETWQSLNEGLYWDVHTVRATADGQIMLATTGGGVYRSQDAGAHWQRVVDGLEHGYPVSMALSPSDEAQVFVAAAAAPPPSWRNGGARAALYRSRDAGQRWTRLGRGLPEQFHEMIAAICVGDGGQVYAAAGATVFASQDAGESWQSLSADLPPVQALALA